MNRKQLERELDAQINRLTKHPDTIVDEWIDAFGLFRFIKPYLAPMNITTFGCVVQIKAGTVPPQVPSKLVNEILADDAVPHDCAQITVANLPVFRKYQLKAFDYYEARGLNTHE